MVLLLPIYSNYLITWDFVDHMVKLQQHLHINRIFLFLWSNSDTNTVSIIATDSNTIILMCFLVYMTSGSWSINISIQQHYINIPNPSSSITISCIPVFQFWLWNCLYHWKWPKYNHIGIFWYRGLLGGNISNQIIGIFVVFLKNTWSIYCEVEVLTIKLPII